VRLDAVSIDENEAQGRASALVLVGCHSRQALTDM
jgi:hypothetical protein